MVTQLVTFVRSVKAVRHAGGNTQPFCTGQATLGMCLVRQDKAQKYTYNNRYPFILFHLQLVNDSGTDQLGVGQNKPLMPSPVLFVHLDNQLLVIRKGEFGQGKYRPFLALSVNRRHIVEGTKRHDNLFLNGGTFCNLFIHHLKSDEVNGEWHVGSVFSSIWK